MEQLRCARITMSTAVMAPSAFASDCQAGPWDAKACSA
jgi:hypothetical protein